MVLKNLNAEIITIGDELLIGQVIDTNSAWIARELNLIGINVHQITSISDNRTHIINALDDASNRADLIIITGGLGPTRDDITKNTIADYFDATLIQNPEVLDHIYGLLGRRGVKVNELNVRQADVPDNCEIIFNSYGTAPGMWFEKNSKVYIFLPGVPFEMTGIMKDIVLDRLKKHFTTPAIFHKTLMLQGIPESMLAQMIESWEQQLPKYIKLAYLPSPGLIRLRLTAKGMDFTSLSRSVQEEVEKIIPILDPWHFADDDESLEVVVGKLLNITKKTISTAESCTGGKIASLITSVPGSSLYFKGAAVTYANEIKTGLLQVPENILQTHGAVSKPVVELMAKNALQVFTTDYAVATSGIAGPDGGTKEKPVGTVWIAVASKNKLNTKLLSLGDTNRERNIIRSSLAALHEVFKLIKEENKEGERT